MPLPTKSPSSLLRVLGVSFGVAMLIGNSIGGGIIRMPGIVAAYVPNATIIILLWVLGGVLALAGALVYAEASAAYQITGGPFVFSEKVFGKQAGFSVGFVDWFFNVASTSALAVAIGEYIVPYLGAGWSIPLIACIIVILLSITQWFGIQMGSAIQKGLSGLKTVGLLFLVVAFFLHGKTHGGTNSTLSLPPVVGFSVIILALRAITFTYSGWNSPIYFSEENNTPAKSIPRSLIIGVALLTFIYVIVNVAMLYMMPASTLATSNMAVADGANIALGSNAKTIVTILSIIIIMSCTYAGILYVPRIIYGLARSGSFFAFVTRLNRYQIPGIALIISTFVCIAIIFTGSFEFISAITTFLYLFVDTTVYLSALVSRWKKKTELPFKAPIFPLLHVFMIVMNLSLIIGISMEDLKSSLYGMGVILITIPLYFIFKRQKIRSATN